MRGKLSLDDAATFLRWIGRSERQVLRNNLRVDDAVLTMVARELHQYPYVALDKLQTILLMLPIGDRKLARGAIRAARKRRRDSQESAEDLTAPVNWPAKKALEWVRADMSNRRGEPCSISDAVLVLAGLYWVDKEVTPPWLLMRRKPDEK